MACTTLKIVAATILVLVSAKIEAVAQSHSLDSIEKDLREMRGTWVMTVRHADPAKAKAGARQQEDVTFIIDDGKLAIHGDHIHQEMTFTLDPSTTPKSIDLASPQLGKLSGIYQIQADSLKICISPDVRKRPTEFPIESESLWELRRVDRAPGKSVSRFPSAPGCYWMVEPTHPSGSMCTLGIVCVYEPDAEGGALMTLAGGLAGSLPPDYRPVLLDAQNNRYLPTRLPGGGSSGHRLSSDAPLTVALSRWRMDPGVLPSEKVALLGIEAVTPELHRAAAREALARAQQEGIGVFPYPEIGQTFDFTITTTAGKTLRSADLRGRVIVIDCWASWCAPCMALLPEIKELYRKWHHERLEVIGVSLDNDARAVARISQELGLDWSQTIAPADEKQREVWQAASGIGSIPRLLVIDRQGVLRLDLTGRLDEPQIVKLLKDRRR